MLARACEEQQRETTAFINLVLTRPEDDAPLKAKLNMIKEHEARMRCCVLDKIMAKSEWQAFKTEAMQVKAVKTTSLARSCLCHAEACARVLAMVEAHRGRESSADGAQAFLAAASTVDECFDDPKFKLGLGDDCLQAMRQLKLRYDTTDVARHQYQSRLDNFKEHPSRAMPTRAMLFAQVLASMRA